MQTSEQVVHKVQEPDFNKLFKPNSDFSSELQIAVEFSKTFTEEQNRTHVENYLNLDLESVPADNLSEVAVSAWVLNMGGYLPSRIHEEFVKKINLITKSFILNKAASKERSKNTRQGTYELVAEMKNLINSSFTTPNHVKVSEIIEKYEAIEPYTVIKEVEKYFKKLTTVQQRQAQNLKNDIVDELYFVSAQSLKETDAEDENPVDTAEESDITTPSYMESNQ